MKKSDFVSVVIPVFNGETCVGTAIESVLAQSHRKVEVIAINDGSQDDSVAVLQRFGDQIKVISQTNAGVARTRNRGIEAATGEFIAFLDQDDYWLPEKLELQLQIFGTRPEIGLVHTAVEHRDLETGAVLPPLNPSSRPEKMIGSCLEELLLGNPLYNSSVVVRREVIDRVGGCNVQLAGNTVADYELWLRIAQHYTFGYIAQPVTIYRMHGGQGMHDRRAMLTAELGVLLSIRPESLWIASDSGRNRLAALYDELAVAHFDAGDVVKARFNFSAAWKTAGTKRSLLRLAVSHLPYDLGKRIQTIKAAVFG